MTAPTFFTVIADYKSVVVDLASDVDADPQLGPITAKVTFTPVLANGDVILATNASPRPTGYVAAPIVARIDTDGRLKLRVDPDGDQDSYASTAAFPATGNTAKVYWAIDEQTWYRWTGSAYAETYPYAAVRLLADTPLLELDSDLYYRVAFSEVVFNGAPGYISPFVFQAPTSDTELNLIEVTPVPGELASGITKIAPGAVRLVDSDKLQFSFGGVDIPDLIQLQSPGSFVGLIGNGSSTAITVTHNMGTRGVTVGVYDAATYAEVECDVAVTTVNTVTLTFATAPATNAYFCAIVSGSGPTGATGPTGPAGGVNTVAGRAGAVTLTSSDVGLGNVNNTADVNKAVLTATRWATARTLAGNSVDGSAAVAFSNKFVVQGTTDTGLSGAQFLGALGTGIVKNTTTTGVLSVATAGDFPTLNQNTSGTAAGLSATLAVGSGGTGATTLTGLVKGTGTTAMVAATAGTDYVAPGGALGTPSSGTLTNATGLPVSGITASTSTALGVGSIELGHATDTTLSRSAAGQLAVEGVAIPTISSTNDLTNKTLINPKVNGSILDNNGAVMLQIDGQSSAANYWLVRNASAAGSPVLKLQPGGSSADVWVSLQPRGAGAVIMYDGDGGQVAQFYKPSASPANYWRFDNSPAGTAIKCYAQGSTNCSIDFIPAGTGTVQAGGNPVGVKVAAPGTSTTAGKPGQWAADASYIYAYTGDGTTHTWVRTAAATW